MKNTIKIFSKSYLWMMPILLVPGLFVLKNNVGLPWYVLAVLINLALLSLALHTLRPNNPGRKGSGIWLTAILLLFGAGCTFISATTFPTTDLQAISSNKFGHYWTSGGFFISELIFLAGITQLNAVLDMEENRFYKFGYLTILTGGMLWFVHLSFRLSAMVWAADQKSISGVTPEFYRMSEVWAGSLYVGYMALTYMGFIGYGLALRRSNLLPRWLTALTLLFGVITPVLFATGTGPFRMPIAIQLIPWLIGIFLIKNLNVAGSSENPITSES